MPQHTTMQMYLAAIKPKVIYYYAVVISAYTPKNIDKKQSHGMSTCSISVSKSIVFLLNSISKEIHAVQKLKSCYMG